MPSKVIIDDEVYEILERNFRSPKAIKEFVNLSTLAAVLDKERQERLGAQSNGQKEKE
jgi:hypothetical protein